MPVHQPMVVLDVPSGNQNWPIIFKSTPISGLPNERLTFAGHIKRTTL